MDMIDIIPRIVEKTLARKIVWSTLPSDHPKAVYTANFFGFTLCVTCRYNNSSTYQVFEIYAGPDNTCFYTAQGKDITPIVEAIFHIAYENDETERKEKEQRIKEFSELFIREMMRE